MSKVTVSALSRHIEQNKNRVPISKSMAKRYLEEMNFMYKRYRYSLKKWNQEAFEYATKVIDTLAQLDHEERCRLMCFDE